ncbi:MAG: hypothetical protein ABI556_16235 [Gemmatimonadales bacterium]
MIATQDSTSRVSSRKSDLPSLQDLELIRRVAAGEEEALGSMVDRWGDRFYELTDALRLYGREADDVIEEVFRRLAFDAARFVVRPDKLGEWLQRTFRECSGSVLARRSVAPFRAPMLGEQSSPSTSKASRSPVAIHFQSLLSEGRLADALGYLNSQTPYRFTAVYRFDGLLLSNLYLFDRESGFGSDRSVARVADTYCLWVHETLAVVQMSDAATDPRARAHPKRELVRSYCGGPIRGRDGALFGTLCHFDFEPRETSFDAMPILEEVASLLAQQIQTTFKPVLN